MALEPHPDENLIAAAEAAASWAHARRAKWTNEPLRVPDTPHADELTTVEFESQPALPPAPPPPPIAAPPLPPALTPVVAPPTPVQAATVPAPSRSTPPATPVPSRATMVRALGAPIMRWVPRLAVAAALIAAAVVGAPYAVNTLSNLKARATAVEPRRAEPPAIPRKPTGTLSITSTPAGAQVLVDGKPRGVTPMELTDVSPGRHEIALKSNAGSLRRTVTVAAGKTATIDEAIFSGWVAVYSPFEISIAEAGRVLRPDDRNQIMLPPGVHALRFVNKALGYDESRQVDVKPGEGTPVQLTPAPSKLTVTATEPAEVLLDGTRIGDAPLTGVGVALGEHEIVVRRTPGGAERRFTVTIGVAPFTLHVDFSQPGA